MAELQPDIMRFKLVNPHASLANLEVVKVGDQMVEYSISNTYPERIAPFSVSDFKDALARGIWKLVI